MFHLFPHTSLLVANLTPAPCRAEPTIGTLKSTVGSVHLLRSYHYVRKIIVMIIVMIFLTIMTLLHPWTS